MDASKTCTINAVERALDVLLLLFRQGREMRLQEIADNLGVYKSTIFRTLATLERKGFIIQDRETKKYWLGYKINAMGILVGNKMPLKQTGRPYLEILCQEFNEIVNLYIPDCTDENRLRFAIVHREDMTSQVLTVSHNSLINSDCHCSAAGKCFMAFHPDVERLIEHMELIRHTPNTIGDREQLLQVLQDVRRNGYALDEEELEIGLMCIAVPVMDKDNRPMAAISFSGPVQRLMSKKAHMLARLAAVSRELQDKLS